MKSTRISIMFVSRDTCAERDRCGDGPLAVRINRSRGHPVKCLSHSAKLCMRLYPGTRPVQLWTLQFASAVFVDVERVALLLFMRVSWLRVLTRRHCVLTDSRISSVSHSKYRKGSSNEFAICPCTSLTLHC